MSKILINNTASPQPVADTGVTIAASSNYTIPPQDYLLWAASSNVITLIGAGTLTVNDGSVNLSISEGTDLIKGIFPKEYRIVGDSDGTLIGNVGDRMKVDAEVTIIPSSGTIPTVGSKLRYDDMNASTGGIARGTTINTGVWTKIYEYLGSGIVTSCLINHEDKKNWRIRLQVDGEEIFGANGILTSDLVSDTAYNLDDTGSPLSPNEGNFGLSLEEHDRFVWVCPTGFPVRYSTSVRWYLYRVGGAKKFNAGLIILTKET